VQDVIERYIASWNQTDPQLRRKLIDEVWAEDASYIDPLAEAHGRDAIDATIAAVQAQFPGFTFSLLSPVDAHHDQARFSWSMKPADAPAGAEAVVEGFDVAVADSDGQLTAVLGFLDKVPG
jgi:SnoaL-like domain